MAQAKAKWGRAAPAAEPYPVAAGGGAADGRAQGAAFPAQAWVAAGGYEFGDNVFHVGVVVASELPRTREALLVWLMAFGPLLPRAIEDLAVLPKYAHERVVASIFGGIFQRQRKKRRAPHPG